MPRARLNITQIGLPLGVKLEGVQVPSSCSRLQVVYQVKKRGNTSLQLESKEESKRVEWTSQLTGSSNQERNFTG